MRFRHVIIGTGRCGSTYIAEVLKSAGVKCGHEAVFNTFPMRVQENIGKYEADSSFMAAEYLGTELFDGVTIAHLVRRPKHVIDSFMKMQLWTHSAYGRYRVWIEENYPGVTRIENHAAKTAYYYLEQNNRIEAHADVFHRVEDDATLLLDKLGIDYTGKELFSKKTLNSRPFTTSDLDLRDFPILMRLELAEMGRRYGYSDWRDDANH